MMKFHGKLSFTKLLDVKEELQQNEENGKQIALSVSAF